MKKRSTRKESARLGELIASDVFAGMHTHDIRARHNVTHRVVAYWAKKYGARLVSCNCLKQKPSICRVIAMLQDGKRQTQVAVALGMSKQRVGQIYWQAKGEGVKF